MMLSITYLLLHYVPSVHPSQGEAKSTIQVGGAQFSESRDLRLS
ncbi:hypothetical protein [Frankia sp. CcWB3]